MKIIQCLILIFGLSSMVFSQTSKIDALTSPTYLDSPPSLKSDFKEVTNEQEPAKENMTLIKANKDGRNSPAELEVKAILLHMTHYDLKWCDNNKKEREAKFDLGTSLQVVAEMEKVGLNTLIVDI